MDSSFSYFMPTKVIFGPDAVKRAGADLVLGKKALIVTGKSSARLSGALPDVLEVLAADYVLFDEVENNPSAATVRRGGELARKEKCDFLVAIGGGSPLDAAKAIGILAVNDVHPLDLYKQGWQRPALPVAAIPTTAGTGSEVTPYSILTIVEEKNKKSLAGPDLFPRVACLDPRYTGSLTWEVTVDTGIDALSHLVEGYLSRRATDASDLTALQGIATWSEAIPALKRGKLDHSDRSALLAASCLGGVTIAQTGTTLVHALGYPLTYFHGLPHGRANGLLMAEYLHRAAVAAPERVAVVLELLQLGSAADFENMMAELLQYAERPALSAEQIQRYAAQAALSKNTVNSPGSPTAAGLAEILEKSISL